ncbi:MAG: AAA family ATPase [bacterium]
MFEEIGIYGYNSIELGILCGIVSGDPVLLIGAHGSAKTALCENLAVALHLNYHAYDASRAMFEDIVGFPDPESVKNKTIEYIKTPMTIWDKEFILIDEISRAQVSMQNKWLEVIRSRKMMGVRVEPLKYVFAAMNPLSYAGAEPLDEALIGRFATIIRMPSIETLDDSVILKIASAKNNDDAKLLREKRINTHNNSTKKSIEDTIRYVTERFEDDNLTKRAQNFILSAKDILIEDNLQIDGRRIGMLFRNYKIMSLLIEQKCGLTEEREGVNETLRFSLPHNVNESRISDTKLKAIGEKITDAMKTGIKRKFVFNSKTMKETTEKFIKENSKRERPENDKTVQKFIEEFKTAKERKDITSLAEVAEAILNLMQEKNLNISCTMHELLMDSIYELMIEPPNGFNSFYASYCIDANDWKMIMSEFICESIKRPGEKIDARERDALVKEIESSL